MKTLTELEKALSAASGTEAGALPNVLNVISADIGEIPDELRPDRMCKSTVYEYSSLASKVRFEPVTMVVAWGTSKEEARECVKSDLLRLAEHSDRFRVLAWLAHPGLIQLVGGAWMCFAYFFVASEGRSHEDKTKELATVLQHVLVNTEEPLDTLMRNSRGELWTRSLAEAMSIDPNSLRRMVTVTVADIAKVCHETNRAYCEALGDFSQRSWEEAPEWQRESAIKGVEFHLANPNAGPSASHDSWLAEKKAAGWKYGPVKDAWKREHPCFVPFEALPPEQQAKDHLFSSIVHTMARFTAQIP